MKTYFQFEVVFSLWRFFGYQNIAIDPVWHIKKGIQVGPFKIEINWNCKKLIRIQLYI